MRNPLYKIVIILVTVIFIPTLFFTVYEISSLNQSEKVLNQIYSNQIDAILFSVNQYSEDVVSSWRNKINNSFSENGNQLINAFLNVYGTVNYLFIADSLNSKDIKIYSRQSTIENERKDVAELLTSKESIIKKLYEYK
jgi:two-component system phosphate regulon sensor histidine kinase PhoR